MLSPLIKYLLVRDVTFFVIDFYTGDRASDLGRLKADQLFRLRDREEFLLNFTFSKTRYAGQLHPFALLRIPNVPVCSVSWLNYYIAACGALGVPLLGEYLFRSSEHKKFVSHRPFGGSAVSARLQKYPKAAGINDGETLHSFRVGISYTRRVWVVPQSRLPSTWVGGAQKWPCLTRAALVLLLLCNLTSTGSPWAFFDYWYMYMYVQNASKKSNTSRAQRENR